MDVSSLLSSETAVTQSTWYSSVAQNRAETASGIVKTVSSSISTNAAISSDLLYDIYDAKAMSTQTLDAYYKKLKASESDDSDTSTTDTEITENTETTTTASTSVSTGQIIDLMA